MVSKFSISKLTVSEPHPSVSQGAYMHSGRGGAGNYFRAPETTPASGVPIEVVSSNSSAGSSSSNRRFFSGRGGAGNVHMAVEAPLMNLDEEVSRAQHRAQSTSGYVGRGGAGNFYRTSSKGSSASDSKTSSRRSSADSNGSRRSGIWARISGQS